MMIAKTADSGIYLHQFTGMVYKIDAEKVSIVVEVNVPAGVKQKEALAQPGKTKKHDQMSWTESSTT